MKRLRPSRHYSHNECVDPVEGGICCMRTCLEIFNRSTVLLHVPEEQGSAIRVIVGGADGALVTIDAHGHIRVLPPGESGDPELRKAVSGILQGVQVLGRLAREANLLAAAN
jgi:hypothetical protein